MDPHEQRTWDVIAVINSTPDAVDLLKDVLERAGFIVVSTFTWAIQSGSVDLEALIRTHQPKVIVYDIAPPYDKNWKFFRHLRETVLKDRTFVLTTVNTRHVEGLLNRDERVFEVVGTPHDLDAIVKATKEAVRMRPVR
jgi:CheY-like chemotaxis protein